MGKKRKKLKFVLFLEYIPFFLLYKFVRILPLHVAYAISWFFFRLAFTLDRKHRIRTIQHMLHAKIVTNHDEATALAKCNYRQFSMLMIEIFKVDQLMRDDSVTFSGNLAGAARAGAFGEEKKEFENIIIVTAHYGNWEIAGNFWAKRVNTQVVSIMRPFTNPYIGELILRNRRGKNHELVSRDGGIRTVFKALIKKKTLALLLDQHANHLEGIETTFFGQPCRTHASAAMLHLKTGVPIVVEVTRRLDDNFNFEIEVGEVIIHKPSGNYDEDIKLITNKITNELEKLIAKHPEQWLWAHRRWLNINRNRQ